MSAPDRKVSQEARALVHRIMRDDLGAGDFDRAYSEIARFEEQAIARGIEAARGVAFNSANAPEMPDRYYLAEEIRALSPTNLPTTPYEDIARANQRTVEEWRAKWEEGEKERVKFFAEMREAIEQGYRSPHADDQGKCQHGTFIWEDCITCYDAHLLARLDSLEADYLRAQQSVAGEG